MARGGVPDEAAGAVLDRFEEVGLVDDEAFARAWVQSRQRGRGLARRALADELRRRGVDGDVVDAAVRTVGDEEEREAAAALVRSRLAATRRLDRSTRMRRLVGLLARRGYADGLAVAVVGEALAEEGAPSQDDEAGPFRRPAPSGAVTEVTAGTDVAGSP